MTKDSGVSNQGDAASDFDVERATEAALAMEASGGEQALSAVFVGEESLVVSCAAAWLEAGHDIRVLVTDVDEMVRWANDRGVPVMSLADLLEGLDQPRRQPPGLDDLLFQLAHGVAHLDQILDAVEHLLLELVGGPGRRFLRSLPTGRARGGACDEDRE